MHACPTRPLRLVRQEQRKWSSIALFHNIPACPARPLRRDVIVDQYDVPLDQFVWVNQSSAPLEQNVIETVETAVISR